MSTQFVLQSAVNFPVAMWIEPPAHFAYQGCVDGSFKLYLYTEDNAPHRVDLYAQGSRSIPWQTPQNKWSHLNPQWSFTDLSGNNINELVLTNAAVTSFDGTTGYLASAEFYYTDDMPSYLCGTILIWATVDFSQYPVQSDFAVNAQEVPGYANSKVIAVAPYLINALTPARFGVTRDGLNPMLDFYWVNAPIPHITSVVGNTRMGSCTAVMKNTPPTNAHGLSGGSIARYLDAIPSGSLTWTPSNTNSYLSALDYQDFGVGGYLRGKVVSQATASAIAISAIGNVFYEHIPMHYPYLWVSNPQNNTLNRIFAPCIKPEWITTDAPFMIELGQKVYNSAWMQVTGVTNDMSLTGFHGVYGIAIGEFKDVWFADAETDTVYKFDMDGVPLSSFNFGEGNTYNFGVTGGCTPASVAIDGLSGVWVTFTDSTSVVCLDEYTGNIKYIINAGGVDVPFTDPTFKPALAEPDKESNLWVTYSNTVCSSLVKYDKSTSYSTTLTTIALPLCSNPMDIHITKTNDVWVSLVHHSGPPYRKSSVNKYASGAPFTLLSSIPAFNPSHLAMDNYESLWFTESGNVLTRVTSGGNITHWTIGAALPSALVPPQTDTFEPNALEGLCCDVYDKIWVINTIDNSLYTIRDDAIVYAIKIQPDQNLEWYNIDNVIYSETNPYNRSAQAFGDWSGNRWMRKYGNLDVTYLSGAISGSSNTFDIYDFNGYDIRRFNESWDSVNEIKKFARSPHIVDNPKLWDGYMKAVWGDASSPQGTGFGREAYERAANFAINHVDVNACNVDQLYNLAQYTDVPMDVYGVSFPQELKRIMDIGSINQQLLWGSRCKCTKNITNTYTTYASTGQMVETNYLCNACGHMHPGNKGEQFVPTNYMVSAFVPFIVDDRTNNNNRFQLITPPAMVSAVSGYVNTGEVNDICYVPTASSISLTSYPLSSYYYMLLPEVFSFGISANENDFMQAITHFCFYDYVSTASCPTQIAGIINWDDQYTTLNESASSIEEWYGSGQTLEKIINYVLHKGLGLIGD